MLVGAGDRSAGTAATAGDPTAIAVHVLRREAVADAEVRVDVAPVRRRPSRASGAACARRRRRSGRRGPSSSPRRARRSPRAAGPGPRLGEQLDQLELAAREVDGAAGCEGLELVARGPPARRPRSARRRRARLGAPAAPDDGLGARDDLLGMARLGDPVVGAEPEPAHALGDGRLAGADHDAELREPRAQLLEVAPRRRGRGPSRSTTMALSRIESSVSSGTGEASTRYCQPAASSRLERTCTKPESESRTAIRAGDGVGLRSAHLHGRGYSGGLDADREYPIR